MKKNNNFIYLLLGLLLALLLTPLAGEQGSGSNSILPQLVFCGTLLFSIWSLVNTRKWFWLACALSGGYFLLILLAWLLDRTVLIYLSYLILLLFCLLVLAVVTKDVIFSGTIDANRLVGSACIYFLLGLVWALLYFLLDTLLPNSFSGISAGNSGQGALQDFIYYSFVTLTTLGYGDILPLSNAARVLSYMEASCGVLYIAILVASLVGTHLSQKTQ